MPTALATEEAIAHAARILRSGGLVAFPTETVYGLGADATSERAVARIFEAKRRPRFDPLIVHLADAEALPDLAAELGEHAQALARAFWPGPLTLVVKRTSAVPDIVTSGLDTVAVRVPSHPVARALVRASGRPIAAPSANPFGYISPTTAAHVEAGLGDAVDLVLDGGPSGAGIESTIVDVSGRVPVLLRPGSTTLEDLEACVGRLERAARGEPVRAPGQLASHYAPRTPLSILPGAAMEAPPGAGVALLAFREPRVAVAATYAAVEVLSPSGDLVEAASRLFACLHRLDAAGVSAIVAEPVPDTGLGAAIRDRLARAAATRAPS